MSGLLMRSHKNAGQDGFRDNRFQTPERPIKGATGSLSGRPPPRKVFGSVLIRSLRPYVRPVDAFAQERWPRWFPRQQVPNTGATYKGGHWIPIWTAPSP